MTNAMSKYMQNADFAFRTESPEFWQKLSEEKKTNCACGSEQGRCRLRGRVDMVRGGGAVPFTTPTREQ